MGHIGLPKAYSYCGFQDGSRHNFAGVIISSKFLKMTLGLLFLKNITLNNAEMVVLASFFPRNLFIQPHKKLHHLTHFKVKLKSMRNTMHLKKDSSSH